MLLYVCGIHVSNEMKWSTFFCATLYIWKKYNVHNWSNSNINITCTDILYNTCNYEKVNSDILYLVCINCGVDHGGSRGGDAPQEFGPGGK